MALKNVFQLKDSVAAILSGIDLGTIDNLDGALERAARTLVQKADVPEASGTQNITLYSGVYDYPCDDRIFGTAINDIRPQGITRNPWDFTVKTDQETFDRTKGYYPSGTMSTFQFQNGTPIIRIKAPFTSQQLIIDPMNAIGNSPNQWVAGGTASNLVQDGSVFYQAPASLRFDIAGTGTGTLTKTLQSPIDMSVYKGVGVVFLAIMIPQGTDPTQLAHIALKIGSDSANYSLVDATTGFLGSWISGEWLLVAYDLSSVSNAGTPDYSAIDYVQVLAGTFSTITNFRVGGLFVSQPSPAQILYQSAAIFKSGSVVSTDITSNSDEIILSNPAYTIYEYESALAVLQQTGGGAGDATMSAIDGILNGARARNGTVINPGLYDLYRGDNPSQELRTLGSYYDGGASSGSYDYGYGNWG